MMSVGKGWIGIASVLLLGVIALAGGYFTANRVAFYAGLLVTLAGVMLGILQLVVRGPRARRGAND